MTVKHDVLWVDLGGFCYCTDHLGGYATADLRQNPEARRLETPLTVWTKLDGDVLAPDEVDGWVPSCEECDMGAK